MSDWEDFCESSNIDPHDPDQFDRALDRWSNESSSSSKKTPPTIFNTFKEASDWARNNPGATFCRTPDGQHFAPVKSSSAPDPNQEFRPNRFEGLKGHEIAGIFKEYIQNKSPHLFLRYTTGLQFSEPEFEFDLAILGTKDLLELKNVLEDMAAVAKEEYRFLMKDMERTRSNPSKYGADQRQRWINTLDRAAALTANKLKQDEGVFF